MTKGQHIRKAILLLIGYAIGLPIVIIGLAGEEISIFMLLVGLVFCGLPFGISFYAFGRRREDSESVAVYNVSEDGKSFCWHCLVWSWELPQHRYLQYII